MLATPPATQLNPIPLFHAAWLFAGGITLAHFFWLRPSLVLVALSLVAALSILAAFRAQRIAWLPLVILWSLLGSWCAEMQPRHEQQPKARAAPPQNFVPRRIARKMLAHPLLAIIPDQPPAHAQ